MPISALLAALSSFADAPGMIRSTPGAVPQRCLQAPLRLLLLN
jgi:hypothetical protein